MTAPPVPADALLGTCYDPSHACEKDRRGVPLVDPGLKISMRTAFEWLCRAQDHSASRDGGVARHFSLTEGWSTSYPETTGYIVPTLIDYGLEHSQREPIERARRMLDWLVSIQFPEGGFQGGMIHQTPRVPVIFNTGQILTGLVAGTRLDERYRDPMCRAADWLVAAQDPGPIYFGASPSPAFRKLGQRLDSTRTTQKTRHGRRLDNLRISERHGVE